MSDQPVIKGETVETVQTETPETTSERKYPFPPKTAVKFAVATLAAALVGGYIVKKVTDSSDEDEEGDDWTVEPVPTEQTQDQSTN